MKNEEVQALLRHAADVRAAKTLEDLANVVQDDETATLHPRNLRQFRLVVEALARAGETDAAARVLVMTRALEFFFAFMPTTDPFLAKKLPVPGWAETCWALAVRQYLVLGDPSFLRAAGEQATEADDIQVADLLPVLHEVNASAIPAFEQLAAEFQKRLRLEDSLTLQLCQLHLSLQTRPERSFQLCEAAASLAMSLPDSYCWAIYTYSAGNACFARGELDEAASRYAHSAAFFHDVARLQPDLYGRLHLVTADALSLTHSRSSRHQEAVPLLEQALETARELYRRHPQYVGRDLFRNLLHLGEALERVRQFEASLETLKEAKELLDVLSLPESEELELRASLQKASGCTLSSLGDFAGAEASLRKALSDRERVGSKQAEGATACDLGIVLRRRKKLPEAEEVLRHAISIARELAEEVPDKYVGDLATSLDGLGSVLSDQGRIEEAEQVMREALECLDRDPNRRNKSIDAAILHLNLGSVLRNQTRWDEAEEVYRRGIEIHEAFSSAYPEHPAPYLAGLYESLGTCLREKGSPEAAEVYLRKAIEWFDALEGDELERRDGIAGAYDGLASVLASDGRADEALDAYRRALEHTRTLLPLEATRFGLRYYSTMMNYASCLDATGRRAEGDACIEELLTGLRAAVEKAPEAYRNLHLSALGNVAALRHRRGNYDAALAAFEEVLAFHDGLPPEVQRGRAQSLVILLVNLSIAHRRARHLAKALAYAERAARVAEGLADPDLQATALEQRGKCHYAAGSLDVACTSLERAADLVEHSRAAALGFGRRSDVARSRADLYDLLVVCLLYRGQLEEAFAAAQRGRGGTVRELIDARAARLNGEARALVDERNRLRLEAQRIDDLTVRGTGHPLTPESGAAGAAREAAAQRRLAELVHRLHELDARLAAEAPELFSVAEPVALDEAKTLAAQRDATLVLFRVVSDSAVVFLVSSNGELDVIQTDELSLDRLSELVTGNGEEPGWSPAYRALCESLGTPNQAAALAEWRRVVDLVLDVLAETLVGPLCRRLEQCAEAGWNVDRLILIPNRGLTALPLHACSERVDDERRYLLDAYEVQYLPDLSFLRREEPSIAHGTSAGFFALVDPDPPGNLQWAATEVNCVGACFQSPQVHEGTAATRSALLSPKDGVTWLHLSCHATSDLERPLESRIALADGPVTLADILTDLSLEPGAFVVLSTCESALADPRDLADEQLGLSTGFLIAGAARVWATLWIVPDLATCLLVARASRAVVENRVSPAKALASAQQWLRGVNANTDLTRDFAPRTVERITKEVRALVATSGERPFRHPISWAGMQCVGS